MKPRGLHIALVSAVETFDDARRALQDNEPNVEYIVGNLVDALLPVLQEIVKYEEQRVAHMETTARTLRNNQVMGTIHLDQRVLT